MQGSEQDSRQTHSADHWQSKPWLQHSDLSMASSLHAAYCVPIAATFSMHVRPLSLSRGSVDSPSDCPDENSSCEADRQLMHQHVPSQHKLLVLLPVLVQYQHQACCLQASVSMVNSSECVASLNVLSVRQCRAKLQEGQHAP